MLRLFVGNIPHACGETELRQWLEEQGHSVSFAQVIRDRVTGHSRGFGFVELQDASDLQSTVERLNGQRLSRPSVSPLMRQPLGRPADVPHPSHPAQHRAS